MPGIPRERFISPSYETFLCPICKDVVDDPVSMQCCDQSFCNVCIDMVPGGKCPQCNSGKKGKPKPMNRQLKELYFKLRLKCLQPACKEKLTVENFKTHDAACTGPATSCARCGFSGNTNGHDCVIWLKEELKNERLKLLESSTRIKSLEEQHAQERQVLTTRIKSLEEQLEQPTPRKRLQVVGDINIASTSSPRSPSKKEIHFLEATMGNRKLKERVTFAMKDAASKFLEIKSLKFAVDVKKTLQSAYGGIWHCIPTEKFSEDKFKYVGSSFCTLIFDGHDFCVFRDEKDTIETFDID